MKPAAFIDRDGTLIEEVSYLDRLDRIALLPSSADALRLLNDSGFYVCVITNQAGVARGYFAEDFVRETHRVLDEQLRTAGARVDRFYYCPHHPEGRLPEYQRTCDCRKPKAGMLRQAGQDLSIDFARSYVIGDRWTDVATAQEVGATGILVRTGYGEEEALNPQKEVRVAAVVADLMDAARWIVQQAEVQ